MDIEIELGGKWIRRRIWMIMNMFLVQHFMMNIY